VCDGVLREETLIDREVRRRLQAFRCFSLGLVLVERCVSKQIAHVRARRGNALGRGQSCCSFAVNECDMPIAQVLSSIFLRSKSCKENHRSDSKNASENGLRYDDYLFRMFGGIHAPRLSFLEGSGAFRSRYR
jgi:hypothetical protein